MQRHAPTGYLLTAPMAIVLLGGVVAPMVTFFLYSFYRPGLFTFEPGFSLENYGHALVDATYWRLAVNSLEIGLVTAVLSVVLGYVLAYYIIGAGRTRAFLLALVSISVFGGYLVRIYAWRIILGTEGILNAFLLRLGLVDTPLELLFTRTAVVLALLNVYIPFAVLLIYAALENVDWETVHAARDLGASPALAFRKITLPLTGRTVFLAFMFVFLLAAADYVTPQLVGGTGGAMIGVAVADQFLRVGNWPLGAAISFLIALGCGAVLAAVWSLLRLSRIIPGGKA